MCHSSRQCTTMRSIVCITCSIVIDCIIAMHLLAGEDVFNLLSNLTYKLGISALGIQFGICDHAAHALC